MLIDRIMNFGFIRPPKINGDILVGSLLPKAMAFNIQNVADYLNNHDDKNFEVTDFPNMAPPFEHMWFEYSLSKDSGMRISGHDFFAFSDIKKVGVYLQSFDHKGEWDDRYMGNPRWISSASLFYEGLSQLPAMVKFNVGWVVSEQGLMLKANIIHGHTFEESLLLKENNAYFDIVFHDESLEKNPQRTFMADMAITMLWRVFLAISFLHCKNVSVVSLANSEKQNRRRKKERKKPLVSFHILHIEPMRQIILKEGLPGIQGIKKALHVCRGHFKDFSKGHGLFGKYKGLFWWNMNVRGTQPRIVLKDYKIETPKVSSETNKINFRKEIN